LGKIQNHASPQTSILYGYGGWISGGLFSMLSICTPLFHVLFKKGVSTLKSSPELNTKKFGSNQH